MKGSPHGTRLNIELGTPLIIQLTGLEERLNSTMIGMESDAFLLIRRPQTTSLQLKFNEGTPLTVRYVRVGTVWGFHTSIISLVHKPARLWFIAYPDRIEHMSLRKHRRVYCYIPGSIQTNTTEVTGLIIDISTAGCRFKGQLPDVGRETGIKPDDSVKITLPLLGLEGQHTFEGIVRNVSADVKAITVGIQFQNVPEDITAGIEVYIRKIEDYEEPGAV